MLEALFGLSRKMAENEPLKIFMALTDIDRNRAKPLETATVDTLARNYPTLGAQYPLFAEVPTVTDSTILAYLDAARAIAQIRRTSACAPTPPAPQALAGSGRSSCASNIPRRPTPIRRWRCHCWPFAKIQNARGCFRRGPEGRPCAAGGGARARTGSPQDHMLDLLAGCSRRQAPELSDTHSR